MSYADELCNSSNLAYNVQDDRFGQDLQHKSNDVFFDKEEYIKSLSRRQRTYP